tara:strand:+ start:194 stop:640 length:447 start_codon:yes stop_codon:yes gene_type:complete
MKKLTLIISSILCTLLAFGNTHTSVTISGNDTMQFDVSSFNASKGTDFKLTFKNTGKLPKVAMGHNLVILKKGVSAIAFGQRVLVAGGNAQNPLPESVMDDVLVYTKLLGPGESDVVNFKVPVDVGVYEYVCTFPGHFAIMRGVMEVE